MSSEVVAVTVLTAADKGISTSLSPHVFHALICSSRVHRPAEVATRRKTTADTKPPSTARPDSWATHGLGTTGTNQQNHKCSTYHLKKSFQWPELSAVWTDKAITYLLVCFYRNSAQGGLLRQKEGTVPVRAALHQRQLL